MLAFSWQNTLVAGMTGISCLRQDIIELPLEGAKGPQFFSTSWLGNSMILLWCFKCSHSAWTALRVYALCWITPMASPVVSSERKIHQLTDTDDLEKKNWFCSLVLELQHIAGPDVERQQGWGKIRSRALSPLDMQKLIYFSNSCCSLGPALTSQRRSPTPYTRAKWQLIHHGLKPAHPCLSSVIC